MTIAQVRQWVRVIPLSFQNKYEDLVERLLKKEVVKWIIVLTLSRRKKIERAMTHAREIAEVDEIYYQYKRCFFGYTKVWVYTKRHYQYKLTFWDSVHFRNPLPPLPQFRDRGRIKFSLRNSPLPHSDPTKTSSYLEIEQTR